MTNEFHDDIQATRRDDRSEECRLRATLDEIRKILETAVCTVDPDKGVVTLSQKGPTHTETIRCQFCNGTKDDCHPCGGTGQMQVQVYEHEYFSPLGDALIKAWELAARRQEQEKP